MYRLQGTGLWLLGHRGFDQLIRDLSLLLREEPTELAEDLEVFRLPGALLAVGLHHVVVDVFERLFFVPTRSRLAPCFETRLFSRQPGACTRTRTA